MATLIYSVIASLEASLGDSGPASKPTPRTTMERNQASFSELEPDSLIFADGLPRWMPEDLDRRFRRGTSD